MHKTNTAVMAYLKKINFGKWKNNIVAIFTRYYQGLIIRYRGMLFDTIISHYPYWYAL